MAKHRPGRLRAGLLRSATRRTAIPPAPIPLQVAGLQLLLRADTLALADGAPVASWPDFSGNGHNAVASGANQPKLRTNALSGKPVVRFDGTSWMFVTGDVTARTLFVVVNHEDGPVFTNYRRILDGSDMDGYALFGTMEQGATLYSPAVWLRNIDGSCFYVNGVNTASALPLVAYKVISAVMNSTVTPPLWIGTLGGTGAQNLLGSIAEVLIYDSALSDTNRQLIEGYLKAHFDL